MPQLSTHSITLYGERVTLRPLTEGDWPVLLRWNSDPEVLYYSEGDDVQSYRLEEVQEIYCTTSQTALCFIIEYQGRPVGECWLQRMNYEHVLLEYPGFDLRRIDLLIGEKSLWGQGLGTEVIGLLTNLAFQVEGADYVLAVDVADYNLRSRRAFEKNEYRLVASHAQPKGSKAHCTYDLITKNPSLGSLTYSVHLFFDPATEQVIRSVWRELAESGEAPFLHHSAIRPHLTLSIYRALDLPEARRQLADMAMHHSPLPVSFQYIGVFPGASPTVFLGPVVTGMLLEVHASICQLMEDLGEMGGFHYYRPGNWVPHCALAVEFRSERLEEIMRVAQRLPLPLNGQTCEIGMTEMHPARFLGSWELQGKEKT